MLSWLHTLAGLFGARPKAIPEALWLRTLQRYPFVAQRPPAELQQLCALAGQFLRHKEFSGAHGLTVTDEIAVAIAAQACLPVLHLGLSKPSQMNGLIRLQPPSNPTVTSILFIL